MTAPGATRPGRRRERARHARTRPRPARVLLAAAVIVALAGAAVILLAGCGGRHHGPAAAAASSGRAAAHAEVTSAGGLAAQRAAARIAGQCKPPGGWNDLYPGVTGAAPARAAFIRCEKIPRGQVFAWGICIGKAYSRAPAGGDSGTAAEDKRQTYLAGRFGTCTEAARKGTT